MKLQITIEGKAYEVDVELLEEEEALPEHHAPFPPPVSPAMRAPACLIGNDDPHVCRSPVNGLAIKVNVQPGQTVQANELIVVLEAMKMETNVMAPRDATVKAVHVSPGDPVKMNQPLVEFE